MNISWDYKYGHECIQRLPKKCKNYPKARWMQPQMFFEIGLEKFQICFPPTGSSASVEQLRESFLEHAFHPVCSSTSSTLGILDTL